ncbi:MAG: hypothetical protein WC378_16590 [Opitutaceae bacterium]|jgi:hypothetical protein
MSHIRKEKVKGFDAVHPAVLVEGIKVAAQLLALQGLKVTEYVYDWGGRKVTEINGTKIICALDAQGAADSRNNFAGMGLAVDAQGKLAIVGDFYYDEQKQRAAELRKQVEAVLGGACYFAARILIAQAKGQNAEVKIDAETHQLQLVVQM